MVLSVAALPDLQKPDDRKFMAIVELIARQIREGEIARGARLMSERELCELFTVSRVTVRKALSELRNRGLAEPDLARGWFVTSDVGEPNRLMGFSEMARARGLTPGSRLINARVRPATLDEAEELAIAPGAELFELERIRLLDGVRVGHEQSRVVLHYAPAIAAGDYAQLSLYDELRRLGVTPYSADYVVQSIGADPAEANILEVPVGFPVLQTTAVTSTSGGRRFELSKSLFRGDRYRFRTTLLSMRRR